PFLWRLHKMHHSDKQLDVSTGLRFHPFEIILSQLFKMLVIIILGTPALAVLLFEIALNAGSLFSHSNFRLKGKTLKTFGLLLVTPNMHEAHHNIEKKTSLHNYGFCLNIWDKAFHTYLPPNTPLPNKSLGLTNITEKDSLTIWKSLTLPLRD
ncbi:MAG: sterol desaturase family protein, partial [Parvibaculales bacterium]